MTGDSITEQLRSWAQGEPFADSDVRSSSAGISLPTYYLAGDGAAPGEYPFVRGWRRTGYRGGPWVMGQYSGYASAKETNERFIRLLAAGQTGLSVALDLPTQLGYDSDAPLAAGEVGRVGVPIDSVEDLLQLLANVPFERVRQLRTTANAIGPMFAAMFLVALEEMGVDRQGFRVMLQNDPLKEFVARGTYIFAPSPSVKLAVDVVEYFARELPHWEPIEFCGYHVRDAGATAVGEVAVMTANGIEYLEETLRRGVDLDALAPALHLFLSAGVDVFEEAAKLRMARSLWARILHEHYGVSKERAGLKIFAYTLGGALTAQEPMNNIVRVAYAALAAALGGVDTLATSSFDEALGLPSSQAAHISLRTQQVLAFEAGVCKVTDPLGGSEYVETLTAELLRATAELTAQILEEGGAMRAIESGFVESLITDSAFEHQRQIESGDLPLVGVNVHGDEPTAQSVVSAFRVPEEWQETQMENLARTRAERDPGRHDAALRALADAARGGANVVPPLIDAARARVTLGEMVAAIASVHGRYAAGRLVTNAPEN